MKFVADGMLGKLARWLRMMGHDVKYSNIMSDSELLTTANEEHRILLTRDLQLYQHALTKKVNAFYVQGQEREEKLAELAERYNFKLDINMATSRCPKCNTTINSIPPEDAAGKVEKNTLEHYSEFWQCPNCSQVYWQGAHWAKIRETLRTAEQKLKNKEMGSA